LKGIAEEILAGSWQFLTGASRSIGDISLLLLHGTYHATVTYSRFARNCEIDDSGALSTLKQKLKFLSGRWAAAGKPLVSLRHIFEEMVAHVVFRNVFANCGGKKCDWHGYLGLWQ
jgi:hypothetical protein